MEKTAIQYLQERLLKDKEIFPQYKEYIDGILYDIYNELEAIEEKQIKESYELGCRTAADDIFNRI